MSKRPIRTIVEGQKICTCGAQTTVIAAARLMEQNRVGAVMIMEDNRLIGIFTERDALFRVIAKGRNIRTTRLSEVMTANPQSISPDRPFGHALHIMHEGGFRHVPVVEHGRPVGMVSARDALGPELAEFASEVQRREQIEQVLA